MTLTNTKTLYEQDFALWIKDTVNKLKLGDFSQVDLENLIEEVDSLGKRDRRSLESRLITLFEHALKRRYVNLPDCYRGWEVTLNRTQQKLNQILNDSPSLRNFLQDILLDCYQKALENMEIEYDNEFPNIYPFTEKIDPLLNSKFWTD
ncbi:DUF29 domain-containing protein [Cyanothece sp. BG0011]|uniref:DUF29 domain-containing protein n=1 Tax=Cyanothece sp. BG0011 TaxID=2082950 RepID=UPI000D1DA553|nr:DUF29 domain-containing protein [Cyanothece sp. BG0011]